MLSIKEIVVKNYVVKLSSEERARLKVMIRTGKHPAQRLTKARILLNADVGQAGEGWSDSQVAAALDTSLANVARTRQQLVEEGFDAAEPAGRQGRGAEHCRQGERQHDRADAQKNSLKPHLKEQFVIPPEASAAFVAAMEDVLEVYHRPHDPDRPLVCVDETSKQLIAETRTPIPAKPGQPERYDYEYERNGTANLFMMFAPREGQRHVKVTDRHASVDYAQV